MSSPRANGPISVGQLTNRVKNLLEGHLDKVWVEGELSQLRVHNGNAYITLTGDGASLRGVVWARTAARFRYYPKQGERVVAFGRMQVYPKKGEYQLIVQRMSAAGEGAREAELEAAKARLAEDGLFEPERKRRLPWLPRAVGVVTSLDGAALRDIIAVIHRRAPQVDIVVSPSQVQGLNAERQLARALVEIQTHPRVDVVIIGRGGGSREDLWAFNDEALARLIATCRVPVISAVGHQTDETVADLVADLAVPTPSAAGEAVVPDMDDVRYTVELLRQRLDRGIENALRQRKTRCDQLARQVGVGLAFEARQLKLERLQSRVDAAVLGQLRARRATVRGLTQRLAPQDPSARLLRVRRQLQALEAQLDRVPKQVVAARADFARAIAQLDALSPLACLGRGYSITHGPQGIVRRAEEVAVGDEISVRLHAGRLRATVADVEEKA